jgi:hypothetical protein
MRARSFGWSPLRRLFYAAATPLLPFYTLSRLTLFALRRRRDLLPRLLASAPVLLAVQLASATGHFLGLLFGIGDAEARFSLFEMNEPRRYRDADGVRD